MTTWCRCTAEEDELNPRSAPLSLRRGCAAFCLVVSLGGVAGCQTPFLLFSGGALTGPEVEIESFEIAADYKLLKLEVRPEDPYSVVLRVVMHDGSLYIDAADHRRWHSYLQQNPDVRIKLGDSVYPARVIEIDDPDIIARHLQGRTIYRVVPRRIR